MCVRSGTCGPNGVQESVAPDAPRALEVFRLSPLTVQKLSVSSCPPPQVTAATVKTRLVSHCPNLRNLVVLVSLLRLLTVRTSRASRPLSAPTSGPFSSVNTHSALHEPFYSEIQLQEATSKLSLSEPNTPVGGRLFVTRVAWRISSCDNVFLHYH